MTRPARPPRSGRPAWARSRGGGRSAGSGAWARPCPRRSGGWRWWRWGRPRVPGAGSLPTRPPPPPRRGTGQGSTEWSGPPRLCQGGGGGDPHPGLDSVSRWEPRFSFLILRGIPCCEKFAQFAPNVQFPISPAENGVVSSSGTPMSSELWHKSCPGQVHD